MAFTSMICNYFESYDITLLQGIVQGISEALPISSSLHLYLLSYCLGAGPVNNISAALFHAGSVIGIFLYFSKDIISMLTSLWRWNNPAFAHWHGVMAQLIMGNVGLAVTIVVLKIWCPCVFNQTLSLHALAWISLVSALMLQYAHHRSIRLSPPANQSNTNEQHTDQLPNMSLFHAFMIGASQIIAMLFSGVSRLGITLTIGCWLGYSLPHMFRWSFLVGLPVISASVLYGWWTRGGDPLSFDGTKEALVLAGVVFLGTWGTLGLMNKLAKHHCLWPLTVYRVLLAVGILIYGFWQAGVGGTFS